MESFIDDVRRHPCLWDTSLEEYKDQDVKMAAWKEIMKANGLPDPKTAKFQWKKLRDNHRDALKRQNENKGGRGNKHGRLWRYQKQMEFLVPYMTRRAKDTSISLDMLSHASGTDDSQSLHSDIENIELENEGILAESAAPKVKRNNEYMNGDYRYPEKRPTEVQDSKILALKDDALDKFFLSMCDTTKRLPEYLQLQIKRKVFNSIMEAEEHNMQHPYTDDYCDYLSPEVTLLTSDEICDPGKVRIDCV